MKVIAIGRQWAVVRGVGGRWGREELPHWQECKGGGGWQRWQFTTFGLAPQGSEQQTHTHTRKTKAF